LSLDTILLQSNKIVSRINIYAKYSLYSIETLQAVVELFGYDIICDSIIER